MDLLENIMPSGTFTGVSGKNYTYLLVSDDILLPLQAGNFIFASGDAAHPVPVFIGAVESVRNDIKAHTVSGLWDIAKDVYGATLLYLHVEDPNTYQGTRLYEQADLIEAYRPPMNVPG